ncbi:MAG: hypothetical protein GY749_48825 [Desulfobacteraceae bacterium]|nr:hypothetical protein [Desulfobacteraceae bacterium]
MRRFHSYGPVDCEEHFCAFRQELVQQCTEQLVGKPNKKGHYFTIWAPRQTGKTWLMRQVVKEIENRCGDRFVIGTMSMQRVIMKKDSPDEEFLRHAARLFKLCFKKEVPKLTDWDEWIDLFAADRGLFEKPIILFIDEFDSLPAHVIDRLVSLFRDIYLNRQDYSIHGLALIGVRAVLGVESSQGSPFNIQRSLHVPNLTQEEVEDLYRQYQEESGQVIEQDVVSEVLKVTRGQPGLVSWFGELITEKFNPGTENPVDMSVWKTVYRKACYTEWNNTVLNLIKKAKSPEYLPYVLDMFARSDVLFSLDMEWCGYLYLNGVIDTQTQTGYDGTTEEVCRFSSPFIQERIYKSVTVDLIGQRMPILALEPLDDLADVFEGHELRLPALLERYKSYLKRLKAKGINPWKDQPRRTDMHLTEWVGHFHLYAWLQNAVGRRCAVSPEFPTGNGRVDLHLRCGEKRGIIEVKSFTNTSEAKDARGQAAKYAEQTGLNAVTVAMFTPVEDESVLAELSWEGDVNGVKVTVVAIGWV